jgi:hypothetical protein
MSVRYRTELLRVKAPAAWANVTGLRQAMPSSRQSQAVCPTFAQTVSLTPAPHVQIKFLTRMLMNRSCGSMDVSCMSLPQSWQVIGTVGCSRGEGCFIGSPSAWDKSHAQRGTLDSVSLRFRDYQ